MLLVANLANTKMMQKTLIMFETLAHEYPSESMLRELSNEYLHDRVYIVFKGLCVFLLWTKGASSLEGLRLLVPLLGIQCGSRNLRYDLLK